MESSVNNLRTRRIYNLFNTMNPFDLDHMEVTYLLACSKAGESLSKKQIKNFKQIESKYAVPFDLKLFIGELSDKIVRLKERN
jgi:hypothetical protein